MASRSISFSCATASNACSTLPFVHTKIVSQPFTCIPEVNLAVIPAVFDILDTDGKEVTTAARSHNGYLQVSTQNYGIWLAGIKLGPPGDPKAARSP